jgi:hypothetical protein
VVVAGAVRLLPLNRLILLLLLFGSSG